MSVTQNNHDRNLIFGIVALHLDFISRDQLIGAMQEWLLDKTRTLGEILLAQHVLSESRKGMLEMLVEEHLQQHGNDAAKSLNTFGNLAPLRDELQSMGDPDIYRAASLMPGALEAGAMALATLAHAPERKPQAESRFSLLRRLAEGGLGVVWVAIDSELVREVALKEIKPQFADHGNSRARFLQEAEITGRLEHPGIVPVYGLGKYLDGRPYYAMRMIKGESLQSAIERFHEMKETGTQRSLALRELLQRFVDVCNAVEYAHSRGILHRDLKPDNVMLGKYGETLVVDWGLAKAIGDADLKTRSDETVIMPELGGDSIPTKMGEVVGTVAYMSPEQAAGKHRELTPASDIFSLGAVLYHIITGVPSQKRGTMPELLRNVREGKFIRPREANSSAPPALEAICLKAMARMPQERYQSAQELAADVERHLADEPVAVFREPALLRFRRWMRHHPKIVTGLAASSLLLIACFLIVSYVQAEANKNLAAQKKLVEETNMQLAVTNNKLEDINVQLSSTNEELEVANDRKKMVLDYLVGVFKSPDPSIGGKDLKVFDVLKPKLDEVLAGEMESDQEGRAELLIALGKSFLGLGIYEEAISANEAALQIREKVLGDRDAKTLEAMNNLAVACQKAGMLSRAKDLLESGLQKTREVKGEQHVDTVNALNNLATFYYDEKLYDQAVPRYQQALHIANQLGLDDPPIALYLMMSLGACYADLRQFDEAIPLEQQAYDGLRQKLGANHEKTLKAMINLGRLYGDLGQFDRAIELLSACYALGNTHFGADHPLTLAVAVNLARVHQESGEYDRAKHLYAEAVQLSNNNRSLTLSYAGTRETMRWLTECYLDASSPANAAKVADLWLRTTSQLPEPDPVDQARARTYLAMAYLEQDKFDAAHTEADAALTFFRTQPTPTADRLRAQIVLGLVLARQNQIDLAASLLDEAFQLAETLVRLISRDTFEVVTSMGSRVEAYDTASGKPDAAARWGDLISSIQSTGARPN